MASAMWLYTAAEPTKVGPRLHGRWRLGRGLTSPKESLLNILQKGWSGAPVR